MVGPTQVLKSSPPLKIRIQSKPGFSLTSSRTRFLMPPSECRTRSSGVMPAFGGIFRPTGTLKAAIYHSPMAMPNIGNGACRRFTRQFSPSLFRTQNCPTTAGCRRDTARIGSKGGKSVGALEFRLTILNFSWQMTYDREVVDNRSTGLFVFAWVLRLPGSTTHLLGGHDQMALR